MVLSLRIPSVGHLHRVAKTLAATSKSGDVYCLYGDIGVGKTEFTRGFIRNFFGNHKISVDSPTYTIEKLYEPPEGWKPHNKCQNADTTIHHIDLYRLQNPAHIAELDFFQEKENDIFFVEWSEHMTDSLRPKNRLDVELQYKLNATENSDQQTLDLLSIQRKLLLRPGGCEWENRLKNIWNELQDDI